VAAPGYRSFASSDHVEPGATKALVISLTRQS
jgi:hypothetical protein